MGFEKVRHIDLPKICDPRGNLSFLENGGVVPFPIARTYWVYDVPGGKKRFGHAFHRQEELDLDEFLMNLVGANTITQAMVKSYHDENNSEDS